MRNATLQRVGIQVICFAAWSSAANNMADTLRVPSVYPTIQAALDQAVDGDTVLVAAGLYTGDGNKNLSPPFAFFGTITVASEGGADSCFIDCENDGRGFDAGVHHGSLTIRGFSILNGRMPSTSLPGPNIGGGIYASASEPGQLVVIEDCVIEGCFASDQGGGVYVGRNVHLKNCRIAGNEAGVWGGGIAVAGGATNVMIEQCSMIGNVALGLPSPDDGWGGGVFVESGPSTTGPGPTLIDCEIRDNVARIGGGLHGPARLQTCRITSNYGEYGGGGVTLAGFDSQDSIELELASCLIAGNRSEWYGGGVLGGASLSECTVVHNRAGWYGGGLYQGDLTLVNSVISTNSALFGANLALESGTIAALWHSTLHGGQDGLWVSGGSFVVAGVGNLTSDPLFVDPDGPDDDPNTLTDNDYSLSPDSPCIDAGDPNYLVTIDALDAAGHIRFWDGDGDRAAVIDMGAYEHGASCPGDLDADGSIDITDLAIVLASFGAGAIPNDGDINLDGVVDLSDLGAVLATFGETCP